MASADPESPRRRVLIVDDEEVICKYLRRALRKSLDCEASYCLSGPAALERPGLRNRILRILVRALRQPGAAREVYLMRTEWRQIRIEHEGTLAQALFGALVQVAGLPE